ncbi:MAG: hypothetical protein CBD18_07440 [Opitutales bacterium TMED158]|nr:MAG: hypothetical protein CBD18_07440 [Opitutales bacterium TMED158]
MMDGFGEWRDLGPGIANEERRPDRKAFLASSQRRRGNRSSVWERFGIACCELSLHLGRYFE